MDLYSTKNMVTQLETYCFVILIACRQLLVFDHEFCFCTSNVFVLMAISLQKQRASHCFGFLIRKNSVPYLFKTFRLLFIDIIWLMFHAAENGIIQANGVFPLTFFIQKNNPAFMGIKRKQCTGWMYVLLLATGNA